jgi:hypothetical protein
VAFALDTDRLFSSLVHLFTVLHLVLVRGGVLVRSHPRVPVAPHGLVLSGKVDSLAGLEALAVTLGESAGPGGHAGLDRRLGAHPVGERLLAILDDGLAGVVSVIGGASLTRSDRSVVNKIQQVLAVASDESNLLTVLAKGIELVLEGRLELLTRDVGQLSLRNEGLSLGANQFLFQDDDPRRVGVAVLELGDLIGDLLLACCGVSVRVAAKFTVANLRSRLGWTEASMLRMLLMVTRYWS